MHLDHQSLVAVLFLVLKTSRFTIRNPLSIAHIPLLYVARGLLNPSYFPCPVLGS